VAPSLLLVEDRAHELEGHYPLLFAGLAATLRDLGIDVTVMTARGWALEAEHPFGELRVEQFGPIATAAIDLARRLDGSRLGRAALLARDALRSGAIVGAAASARRRLGAAGVISVSRNLHPFFAAAFADRSRWAVFRFDPPSGWMTSRWARPVAALGRRRNARRQALGGAVALLVNNQVALDAWRELAPWLPAAQIQFMFGHHDVGALAGRAELGLPSDGKVALVFGSAHGGKDFATVFDAFDDLPGWSLVVGGAGASTAYAEWARGRATSSSVIVFDGFVDIDVRSALFACADAVVMSFRPWHVQDSGILVDAVAAGTAVVCSAGPSADMVRDCAIGEVFEPGSVESLRAALQRLRAPGDRAWECARAALAPQRGARVVLEVMGVEVKDHE
jgi:glycosyltransferase involved in cell wall biosynthesis